jgi:5,10-methylenetetrahydrofolate reductase
VSLKEKLLNPDVPLTLFEIVPPEADKPEALDAVMGEVAEVRHLVDAINLPEIHDEARGAERTYRFVARVEPRRMGERIQRELSTSVVVNRVVVHDPDPLPWFAETRETFGIEQMVLVGGESAKVQYPGPGPLEAARMIQEAGLPVGLGGIIISSRANESDRVRAKQNAGMAFFTTQILFDSNDIVWLIQKLNGLEARIFLSFAPVSHPGDLKFLRWLGADIPPSLDRFLLGEGASSPKETCFERSLDMAQRILMDVFDNLPPDPPLLGLNVEHVNRRNLPSAIKMLKRLGGLYSDLIAARVREGLA